MAGVVDYSKFDDLLPGVSVNTGVFFGDAGGTLPADASCQEARAGSHPLGLIHRYLQYKRTTAATGFVIHAPLSTGTTNAIRFRWYQTIVTNLSSSAATVYLTSAGTNRAQVFISTTRTAQLRNVAAAVGVASAAMTLGKRYRFEWLINMPSAQQRLIIYDTDESTVFYDSGLVAVTSAAYTQLRCGNTVSATLEIHYACFAESNDATNEIGEIGPEHGFPIAA